MRLHRFCSVQTAILIIVAAEMAVSSANKIKKIVDLVFVVERSPLPDPGWKGSIVDGYLTSIVLRRWVNHWLYCMEWDKGIKENLDAGYMAFILDITRDKLEQISPFTNSIKEMRDNCEAAVGTYVDTQPRPTRLQETPAIIKKVRDAIRQPYERKGVPVILLWHVPYIETMEPHEAILNLTKTKNGPEAVISNAAYGPNPYERIMYVCFDCYVPERLLFKHEGGPKCNQLKPFINKSLDPLWQCETVTIYTPCYFDEWGDCLADSMYAPKEGTHPKYINYCRSGLKKPGERCGKGDGECDEECKRSMQQTECSASCGTGSAKTVRPAVTDKFTRHCPVDAKVPCVRPPCPTTTTQRPITHTTPRRPVTTRMTTTRMTTTATRRPVTAPITTAVITGPSTPDDQTPDTVSPFTRRSVATRATPMIITPAGIGLQPWMIAVLVIAAVALLAVMIGVFACCLRKRRKPPAAAAGSRFHTRQSAPRRYVSVARSPGRTQDRQPPRYLSRPRAPSPTDRQRPHTHRRPSKTYTGSAQTYENIGPGRSRSAYASLPSTWKAGQSPRHRS